MDPHRRGAPRRGGRGRCHPGQKKHSAAGTEIRPARYLIANGALMLNEEATGALNLK